MRLMTSVSSLIPHYGQGPRRLTGYIEGHTGTTSIAFQLFRPGDYPRQMLLEDRGSGFQDKIEAHRPTTKSGDSGGPRRVEQNLWDTC